MQEKYKKERKDNDGVIPVDDSSKSSDSHILTRKNESSKKMIDFIYEKVRLEDKIMSQMNLKFEDSSAF